MSRNRWGAGGATSEATTAFVRTAHSDLGLETCMHLTCTNMPVEMVNAALKVRYIRPHLVIPNDRILIAANIKFTGGI